LRWPAAVRDEFLAGGGDAIPPVEYPPFDEHPIVEAVREIRRSIYPGGLVDDWLESVANSVEQTARMLAARGTESFLRYNRALYGTPRTPLRYDPTTPLELAERVHEVLAGLDRPTRWPPPAASRCGPGPDSPPATRRSCSTTRPSSTC
jgi:Domain of unknown function (DUF1704)